MKTESLTLRITPTLRVEAEKMAKNAQKKLSNLVREILENEVLLKTDYKQKTILEKDFNNTSEFDFFNSNGFIFLYSWIMEKMMTPYLNKSIEPTSTIFMLKKMLFSTINNSHIPFEVKREFEKILQDVLQYDNQSEYLKSFRFNQSGNSSSVNFLVIINFLKQHTDSRFCERI